MTKIGNFGHYDIRYNFLWVFYWVFLLLQCWRTPVLLGFYNTCNGSIFKFAILSFAYHQQETQNSAIYM